MNSQLPICIGFEQTVCEPSMFSEWNLESCLVQTNEWFYWNPGVIELWIQLFSFVDIACSN